jgi:transcription termination/antitermination protein NusA
MMNPNEILRLVDGLHRQKDIESEVVFQGIEAALLSAARKHFGASDSMVVSIDRESGEVTAYDGDNEIDPSELGRIAAQTAKQVMIQKIREAERDSISHEYEERVFTVVTGTVQRFEGPNIVVSLSRTEGFLPRSEQIPGESYHVGERVRALILEVRSVGSRVRVVLTRTHPEFVRQLFQLEVPEVADEIVEIRGLAREPGHRTKIAVDSNDPRVDCVGACVGVQGSRIRSIVDELNGEKIDIVRWSDDIDMLIANTLKPAEVHAIDLNEDRKHALVIVLDDQLSLAIGKRGQNVRLAAKMTTWDIDIKSLSQIEDVQQIAEQAASEPVDEAGSDDSVGEPAESEEEATVPSPAEEAPQAEDEAAVEPVEEAEDDGIVEQEDSLSEDDAESEEEEKRTPPPADE